MAKLKHRSFLASVILIMQLVLTPSAYADRRLEVFLEKYDALNGRTPPLSHADSLFYPYHKHLFENGLDAAKLNSLRAAQKKGNCIVVDKLVIEGFLGLFPFLKPAFDERKYHTNLWFMIAKDRRPEHGRCYNHQQLRELLTLRSLEQLPPVDFAGRSFGGSYDLLDPKAPRKALRGFGERAFCDDYPPSIADLRAIANRPGGMVLTEQEGLYLLERARVHNLEISDYDTIISRFEKHFSSSEEFLRLRDASRRGKLVDIPFTIEGYWQKSCRFLVRSRREEK